MKDALAVIAIGFACGVLTALSVQLGLSDYGTAGNLVGTSIGSAITGAVLALLRERSP